MIIHYNNAKHSMRCAHLVSASVRVTDERLPIELEDSAADTISFKLAILFANVT